MKTSAGGTGLALADRWYTVKEAAAILQVGVNRVYDLIRDGVLHAVDLNRHRPSLPRRYRVPHEDLMRFKRESAAVSQPTGRQVAYQRRRNGLHGRPFKEYVA